MSYKFKSVYKMKIFPLEYLMNEELTDNDLEWLFDKKSLLYSLILGMFNFVGVTKRNCDIVKQIKTDSKWMYKYFWNTDELNEFENMLVKIYQNLYIISEKQALQHAQWFITIYGLTIKGNRIDL